MTSDLTQQAIYSALNGDWEKAKTLNKEILKDDPTDVNALNRLARSYAELNDLQNARKVSSRVLEIDNFNQIAIKTLDKWNGLKDNIKHQTKRAPSNVFLEEPGKTKILELVNIGSKDIICQLDAGDEVTINAHGHLITLCTNDGKLVGKFPDVFSRHVKNLIKHGNEYKCYIKSANKNEVSVIIRETKRSQRLKDIASFSSERMDVITIPDND